MEIRIHGRGGQGGVTLAKLLAAAEHRLGRSVQAFGIYAAERSGAPLQAFLRCDDQPIRNPNMIYRPDHIIVLDPTLIEGTREQRLEAYRMVRDELHRRILEAFPVHGGPTV